MRSLYLNFHCVVAGNSDRTWGHADSGGTSEQIELKLWDSFPTEPNISSAIEFMGSSSKWSEVLTM